MSDDTFEPIGQWLIDQHTGGQQYVSQRGRIKTVEEGYAAQRAFVAKLLALHGGTTAGYKIGLTTQRMQAMCGIAEPIAGVVLSERVHRSESRISLASYGRLGIESEIGLSFGSDLPTDCSREHALANIRSVHAAFELIDDRHADYAQLDAPTLVADNSWNAGVVLGPAGSPDVDLASLGGRLLIDGVQVDAGSAGDALGHPIDVVVWLTKWLAVQGKRLRAGEIVMTGSLVTTKFAEVGQLYRLEIDGLPPVEVAIDP